MTATDLTAADIAWDLETLLPDPGDKGVDTLLDEADAVTARIVPFRGRIAECSTDEIVELVTHVASLSELIGRASSYAGLRFATDTSDPARGALMMRVEERATAMSTQLVFFELEWAAVDDAAADVHLADPRLEFAAHHLRSVRRYRPHLLTEPEEVVLTEKNITGASAWVRLFDELESAIVLDLDGESVSLEAGSRDSGRPTPRRAAPRPRP